MRNGLLSEFRKKYGLKSKVYEQHKLWLGDLSNKKVLDLGCLCGNALSIYMAERAPKYIGIDLSEPDIAALSSKLAGRKLTNASAIAMDFLSPQFRETNFDVIYAYGVLHHFENLSLLVDRLNDKLKSGGIIISYDPLATSPIIKFLRYIYRPFQTDRH